MFSVVQNNPRFTGGDVEYSFDGNICRCTGYRPIIDAFKSLAVNPSEELKRRCQDIEECYKCPLTSLPNDDTLDDPKMEIVQAPRNLLLRATSGQQWIKVTSMMTLFDILRKYAYAQSRYRLVAGNTGTGVFKNDGPYEFFIEINDVPELHFTSLDRSSGLVLGGGTTLTAAIDQFDKARSVEGFAYASEFFKLFRRIASLSIRNQGTLAGNLMMKHAHPEFTSDVFLLFESVGATIKIGSSPTLYQDYSLLEFLDLDMNGKVILSIHLPTYKGNYVYRCFKIGKRYQNAQAYVNAAFLFNVDNRSNFAVVEHPSICYGGINPTFTHAHNTEEYLNGKQLTVETLQNALSVLAHEAVPNVVPESGTPQYRLSLAQAYLYKFILGVRGEAVNPRIKSGAMDVERGLNVGYQTYDTDRSKWPLYQPIPKIESYPQASGEAEYINDIRAELDELFGVFVLTTVANADIKYVDASKAMMIPNVVAFITARDIPGNNNHAVFLTQAEEIFVTKRVKYAGQPVGLLVAKDKYTAFEARSSVVVTYTNIQKPVVDIRKAVKSSVERGETLVSQVDQVNLAFPCRGLNAQTSQKLMENLKKTRVSKQKLVSEPIKGNTIRVKGEFKTDRQYHFHLETQICICVPKEDGMDVFSSTQHMDNVQAAIGGCLNIPNSSINVKVRRLGGGFGAKISKAAHIATACAIAAHVTNKPVRVAMDLETNMQMIGKRLPYLIRYEADVDEVGKIHKLVADIYCDPGFVANEPTSLYGMICFQSCYQANGWDIIPGVALTDTASNTYCRAPGSAQGVAAVENIMEHIAFILKKDPLEIRQVNFIRKGDPFIGVPGAKLPLDNLLPKMIKELMETSNYLSRKKYVENFNQGNRWKKRGISMIPQRYPNYYPDLRFPTFISVYHVDGTVSVSHGGIEMGQGINTKVAQVVAHALNIPIDTVRIKPSNNLVSPNAGISGASVSSELVCSVSTPKWIVPPFQLFKEAQGDLVSYDVWGVAVSEVEVDVLTGDYKIIRVDLIEDAGQSLSPLVDIGQIEGGFIMGLGWWLTEELVYDQSSGQLLTDNTWNYKPMLPADIPEDLRVTLLRKAPNPYGVLSSKAVGEPPFNLSVSVIFAIRNAIDSARREVGNNVWYQMGINS
ncbi:unnamed protein product [Orchesella dallaii]|uniref:FAD-binding PCMH-type domain-containing protein n=1 Tax=Orchesella dallaii TaxID=48710 RepID=A0ABP1QWB1_9HEXA